MNLSETGILGVFVGQSTPVVDPRGRFTRLFCKEALNEAHKGRPITQINHSLTRSVGAIRGMHYQTSLAAEGKWVRCLRGRVIDVAIDLRRGSPTLCQWVAVELSADQANCLFIPEGCAHGFQVLEADSELLYLHSASYAPAHEAGVRWDDPKIGIKWPLAPVDISVRDQSHPLLPEDFEGIAI